MSQRLINTYDQLCRAGGGVAISPHYTGTRTQYFNGWAVWRINAQGKKLICDLDARWADHGAKVFSTLGHGGSRAERAKAAREEAMRWVAEQGWYDGEWKRNRMRDYVPKAINDEFPLRKEENE